MAVALTGHCWTVHLLKPGSVCYQNFSKNWIYLEIMPLKIWWQSCFQSLKTMSFFEGGIIEKLWLKDKTHFNTSHGFCYVDRFDMKHFPEVAEHEILKLRIEKAFPKSSEKEWFECYSNVLECVKKSQYVS